VIAPLRELRERIAARGLDMEFDLYGLGELAQLATALESATRELLEHESQKVCDLKTEVGRSREQTGLQTELLHWLVRDLRSSVSSIMGHAELLMASDSKPADRVNYIRGIQREARRIAHVVRELNELLPAWGGRRSAAKKGDLPIDQLRLIVQKLSARPAATLQISPADHHRSAAPIIALDAGSAAPGPEDQSPDMPPPARLSGSIVLLGRRDDVAQQLLGELNELGLDVVWVPDLSAFAAEADRGDYDLVIVNLSRGDRTTRELSEKVRSNFAERPVVAALPTSMRGDGNTYVGLGFDDYLYAPASRQQILAVIGKYIGFKPIR
jgi:CheY-like chemotaxis protein